jgi:erythromycin esterase
MKTAVCVISVVLVLSAFIVNCRKDADASSSANDSLPTHQLRNAQDLDVVMNEIGNARIVLLGEASHDTSEFYQWRATLSKRLIQENGFDMIAVEGEWADSYRVNQFIRGSAKDSL